jgi:hypothetical protein
MDYDQEKVDEAVLALLYLTLHADDRVRIPVQIEHPFQCKLNTDSGAN